MIMSLRGRRCVLFIVAGVGASGAKDFCVRRRNFVGVAHLLPFLDISAVSSSSINTPIIYLGAIFVWWEISGTGKTAAGKSPIDWPWNAQPAVNGRRALTNFLLRHQWKRRPHPLPSEVRSATARRSSPTTPLSLFPLLSREKRQETLTPRLISFSYKVIRFIKAESQNSRRFSAFSSQFFSHPSKSWSDSFLFVPTDRLTHRWLL